MRIWLRRIFVLLAAYQLLRVGFLILNADSFAKNTVWELVAAFVIGLRFDISAISSVNIPLMALHTLRIIPMREVLRKTWDQLINILFVVLNLPILVISVVDTRMFAFTGRRTSPDFFGIVGDIGQQSFGILLQYWWLTSLGIVACALLIYLCWQRDFSRDYIRRSSPATYTLVGIVCVALAVLAIRGGLQRKPLAPAHAYAWQPVAYSNLILNTGMTLLRSPPAEAPTRFHDFSDMDTVRKILTPDTVMTEHHVPLAQGKNVVIILVESLATEYVGAFNQGEGYTPFIDTLIAKSVTFADSFANGRRSIDAMPAVFAGIPAWRDQPFVTSPFNGNRIVALPRTLKEHGYESYFFHGAANGSMHFDIFSALAGFDHYVGLNEYPNSGDSDGQWGIFDEPFLDFAADTLNRAKSPFLAGIFTLSSHNPFAIPAKYKGKFPVGNLPIHESIGYADFALKQFFAKAQTMPWYRNTIFVITGDHTSLSNRPGYDTVWGRFRVPIFIYDPTESLPKIGRSKIAQHVDIAPTVLDLLGVDVTSNGTLFGWSLFDPAYRGRFIQSEYNHWYSFDGNIRMQLDEAGRLQAYDRLDVNFREPLKVTPEISTYFRDVKAARQYYSNGLLDNSWVKQPKEPSASDSL